MVFQPPATLCVFICDSNVVILRSLLDIVIKDVRLGSSCANATMDGQSQKRTATHLVPSLHGCHGNHRNMDVHLLCKKKRKTTKPLVVGGIHFPLNNWRCKRKVVIKFKLQHQICLGKPSFPPDFFKEPLSVFFGCYESMKNN